MFHMNSEVDKFNASVSLQQHEESVVRLRAEDMYLRCVTQDTL